MPKIKFTIITLFEDAIKPYLNSSMMWKAQEKGIAGFDYVNLRDFGLGPHKSVDDTPYGGGNGMLLRPEPVFAAIESVKEKDHSAEVILPTPAGTTWNQSLAKMFANRNADRIDTKPLFEGSTELKMDIQTASSVALRRLRPSDRGATPATADGRDPGDTEGVLNVRTKHYIILCPHYEGYDERILSIVDHQISLGPYILTGGELPALIIIDSIVRLLPGVLGGEQSAAIESFSDGDNIEYPQYTKPADFRGMKVPEVLLSGHHQKIAEWRSAHSKKPKTNN